MYASLLLSYVNERSQTTRAVADDISRPKLEGECSQASCDVSYDSQPLALQPGSQFVDAQLRFRFAVVGFFMEWV